MNREEIFNILMAKCYFTVRGIMEYPTDTEIAEVFDEFVLMLNAFINKQIRKMEKPATKLENFPLSPVLLRDLGFEDFPDAMTLNGKFFMRQNPERNVKDEIIAFHYGTIGGEKAEMVVRK